MKDLGDSIAFRLRGHRSNRDAIGAEITVEAGTVRQTKYLQAGSGFLSQHTKEVFFGLGKDGEAVRATIRWPSGLTQSFQHLPVNRRIEIEEGSSDFLSKAFAGLAPSYSRAGRAPEIEPKIEPLPSPLETWLIEPLSAPDFSLPDLAGDLRDLHSFRGSFLLLNLWATGSTAAIEQLRHLQKSQSTFASGGLRIVAINLDAPSAPSAVQAFAGKEAFSFPILLGTEEVAGVYNIVYRYLFDRRRDLTLPTSFLLDESGMIVKVYQGVVNPGQFLSDVKSVPRTDADRVQKALPFSGWLSEGGFQRNDFTYGVAMFQHGYLDQAAASFRQVIAAKPQEPEAYYNLGTLYLRRNDLSDARRYLEQTVELRPNYPEAWNNLGMIAAQEGRTDDAVHNFQRSLALRPTYTVALLNLGNFYRRQGNLEEAEKLLSRGLEIEPNDPETNYSLGMLYAHREQLQQALQYLQRAVELRPDYPDALNNLGVVFVREQRYSDAEERLKMCITLAPGFDQAYLNLARLYVVLKNEEKAKEILQALLRLQPQHKMAQEALEMLH